MRFPLMFQRQVGGASSDPALGSDTVPTHVSGPTEQKLLAGKNVLQTRLQNIVGWPVQRVAIGYAYAGVGVAPNLSCDAYVWEDESERWYKVTDTPVTLKPYQLTFIDSPIMIDTPRAGSSGASSPGALEVLFIVSNGGAPVNGVYTIVAGGDASNTP